MCSYAKIGHFTWLCEVKGSGTSSRHRVESTRYDYGPKCQLISYKY